MAKKRNIAKKVKNKCGVASWFPSSENAINYAFRRTLFDGDRAERNKNVASIAIFQLEKSKQDIIVSQADLSVLSAALKAEREAEIKFLDKVGIHVDPSEQGVWKSITQQINFFLSNKNTIRRNIERIRRGEAEIDITRNLMTYVQAAMQDYINTTKRPPSDQDIQNIFLNAIRKMYDATENKKTSEEYKAYADLKEIFDKLTINDSTYQMFQGVVDINELKDMFKEYSDALKENETRKRGKKIDKSQITVSSRGRALGGALEVQETIRQNLVEQIQLAIQTGNLNYMKADIIASTSVEINDALLKLQNKEYSVKGYGHSVRQQNIARMEQFLKDLEDAQGDLIFTSAKNYNLKGKFFEEEKGFEAENPTFNNFSTFGSKLGLSSETIMNILFILSNTDKEMIGEDGDYLDAVRVAIGNVIAGFLFDDVLVDSEILKATQVNRIHLLDIGGLYVPLSVYLEKLYEALSQEVRNQERIQQYVNVVAHNTAKYKKKKQPLVEQDWIDYRNERNANGTLSIRFLYGFSNLMNEVYNNLTFS